MQYELMLTSALPVPVAVTALRCGAATDGDASDFFWTWYKAPNSAVRCYK